MRVVIYTCVYNGEKTLAHTIESVLRQSYQDFEYHIEDNGSEDGTRKIIYDYAERDNRIVPHIRDVNHAKNGTPSPALLFKPPDSDYYTNIDGDDWWEPDYLERLLAFAERFCLDIACTGTVMHDIATGGKGFRQLPHPLVLEKGQFPEGLPYYHAFFRTIWGKLIRSELVSQIHMPATNFINFYGGDTVYSFQLLRHANRIGIDNSVLHHYRIAPKTLSSRYSPERFASDVYLYNDAVDFLSAFGPVSARNLNFLQCVYSNAVIDTTGVVRNSTLSPVDKLREYRAIASHPITLTAYRECTDESAVRSRNLLLQRTLQTGADLKKQNDGDLRAVMQTLLPHCGQAVTAANAELFLEDAQLLQSLLRDEPEPVLENLLERLEKNQGVKKYALPEAIQALAVDNPLLCQISDAVFLRKYGRLYMMVWREEYLPALEEMTGLLLKNQVSGGRETFLQLYISLAAVENQEPAFLYGKLQLAQLYLRQSRLAECRAIVSELEEMGLTDNEELINLVAGLQQMS